MNSFEMVVLIVAIVMIAGIARQRFQQRSTQDDREAGRLREEVQELKERVKVLERIATDGNRSLEQQIEELRNH